MGTTTDHTQLPGQAGSQAKREPRLSRRALSENYRAVRQFTERLCEPLVTEDYVIQSMPDVSPAKWHLAHTSWFFETLLLKPNIAGYESPVPEYAFLFNSYYNSLGKMHARDRRGVISRPTVEETYHYRRRIDEHMLSWLEQAPDETWATFADLVELGLNHEQQHQELLLTDIKHVFAQNPLHPVYRERKSFSGSTAPDLEWVQFDEGLYWIGHSGDSFAFDNEGPRHREFAAAFELASRLVTNGEFLQFIADGGYQRPEFWLSAGWFTVQSEQWEAPLYWERRDGRWFSFTLSGLRPVAEHEPVCHLSYYEADAFARWSGARLPTEAEWEIAAGNCAIRGNFVEEQLFHPSPPPNRAADQRLWQMMGDVWEWTRSAYAPYPGYRAAEGPLGEYNGKFMCNQMVLRGGSCVTSRSHIRRTYRNFFQPEKRWQFSGLRLARDV